MTNSMISLGDRSERSVSIETGIPLATLRRRLVNPFTMTVGEMLRIAECLGISPGELLKIATTPTDGLGHHDH